MVFPAAFSKAYDHFDCQPVTPEQSSLSALRYFGNVVCKPQLRGGKELLLSPIPDYLQSLVLKNISAINWYFLEFPCMVSVFAIIQPFSLGAKECLQAVLLYGFEFRTARVLVFGLG